MKKPLSGIFLLTAALLFSGCQFEHAAAGPERNEPISIEAGDAQRADVELDIGAGQLEVSGGSSKLIEGTFTYNVDAWKPIVKSSTNGSHAAITIKQPESGHLGGDRKYDWDLRLNDGILLDMAVNCGAGQARLNLGSLQLRTLGVHMGAGQVNLDLRGKPAKDYDVKIDGGVGQATVALPQGVGVWAEAHGGLGSINITGLEKKGDHWENDLYEKAKVNVKLEVNGGNRGDPDFVLNATP